MPVIEACVAPCPWTFAGRAASITNNNRLSFKDSSGAGDAKIVDHGIVAFSGSSKADNAFIESFWSSLKYELVYHHRFATLAEARIALFDYIETFYNRTRLHSSLDYQSPINFESKLN